MPTLIMPKEAAVRKSCAALTACLAVLGGTGFPINPIATF
jgi:hypothetical protein